MSTDLENLPGYPGHDQVQTFVEGCVRDIPGGARSDAVALRAELNRRAGLLSEEQVGSLAALSPQTRKLRLRASRAVRQGAPDPPALRPVQGESVRQRA